MAEALNNAGFSTKEGKKFRGEVVRLVLMNPLYRDYLEADVVEALQRLQEREDEGGRDRRT